MADRESSLPGDDVTPLEDDFERRRALGIYYTPRSAAAMLAGWAIRRPSDMVLEPSFGGCTILEAALNQLKILGCANPAKRILGFDIDQAAFSFLHRLLGRRAEGQFTLQDFLAVKPGQIAVETIIANPPFVAYHRMGGRQRRAIQSWRKKYEPPFPMTASLWAYFLLHSLSFLKPNGRLAFVLPSAATSSDYARPLMEHLSARFAHLSLYRISEQLFLQAGAAERTVILLAEGYLGATKVSSPRKECSVSSIEELRDLLAVPDSAEGAAQSQAPASAIDHSIVSLLHRKVSLGNLCNLRSVATVSIGEVVGDIEYFVKPRDAWHTLGITDRSLHPLVTRTRQLNGLRVTSKDVADLYSAIPRLLTPPGSRLPQRVARYLDSYSATRRARNKTFVKRNPWYAVSYDPTATGFIGSLSHESPRIVLNAGGISCANGLYKLKPLPGFPSQLQLSVASLTSVFQISAELQARIRGAGALKLEPRDVGTLLLPALDRISNSVGNRSLLAQLDSLIRRKELVTATRQADDMLLIQTGLFSRNELRDLRDQLQELRGSRLASRTRR